MKNRIVLSVMVLAMTACGVDNGAAADDVQDSKAAVSTPSCHEVATAWCDAQAECPRGATETCHADVHVFCEANPSSAAVSQACVDQLMSSCVGDALPFACGDFDASGIGTSPSDPGPGQAQFKTGALKPCGLWIGDTLDDAELRHTSYPSQPDVAQYPLPGGVACSALLAAVPAIEASWSGRAVVRYFDQDICR
jgi:hypothetical protein